MIINKIMVSIAVIGVGKLGLCLALVLEQNGYSVVAIDKSTTYIRQLQSKEFISYEKGVNDMLQQAKNIVFTTELTANNIADCELILIVVDTFYNGEDCPYDCRNLDNVLDHLSQLKIRNRHIVINSTVFPGYCNKAQLLIPPTCSLSYNPEFIAQGDIIHGMTNPDMVLIGSDPRYPQAGKCLQEMYERICVNNPHICIMSSSEAEITKLAVNCFLTTKISFANFVGDLAGTIGGNSDIILQAIGCDSRIGHKYLKAGYGFDGPCFPRDNRALGKFAKQQSIPSLIPIATDEYNNIHTRLQIEKLLETTKEGDMAFEGSVAYKPGTIMLDNSQKLIIAKAMIRAGRNIKIKDHPLVIEQVQKDPIIQKYSHHVEYVSLLN